jgi:hypothetical protein
VKEPIGKLVRAASSGRREDCADCGSRFHRGQWVVQLPEPRAKLRLHLSCFAFVTEEGTSPAWKYWRRLVQQ